MNRKTTNILLVGLLCAVWGVAHLAGIFFGATDIPMHQTYVADEQRPVNGALHILEAKSPFGLRGAEEFWYGPIFAVLATPAIIFDFGYQYLFKGVHSAQQYRDNIVFDWGGIILGMRVTVVLAGFVTLFLLYRLFLLKTVNPTLNQNYALVATSLVGVNYFFFENSNFFINWTFVVFLLIAQLYVGLLIHEDGGRRRLYWWLHGVVTVLNFGINYINAIYLIAYLPLGIRLWRENKDGVRRNIVGYVAGISFGLAFIIWWNPFTFIRLLGQLGIGSMAAEMATEYGTNYNPLLSEATSFAYYAKVLFLNHFPIFIILATVFIPVFVARIRENFIWIWMFGSVALIHLLTFGLLTHYEQRYILVTIVMVLLLAGSAAMHYNALTVRNKTAVLAIGILLVSYFIFHAVHVGKWIQLYAQGPAEKQMIAMLLDSPHNNERTALIQGHLAGQVHTKEAYQKFLSMKKLEDVNLYKTIMSAPLPQGVSALDVTYIMPADYERNPEVINNYDNVFQYVQRCSMEINQATYIGENILSLWYWDYCRPLYKKIR